MNSLSRAASPYLRQHQDNPVDWVEWGDEAFARARAENKLLLISVGYAACHWCHVMAHESFEDEDIAAVMNRHFVCIKVDREERPDVDQIYLEAVQLMTGRGGWPLNCFVLPDGQPVFGGTYFQPGQWQNILTQLAEVWQREPESVKQQAEKITSHLRRSDGRTGDPSAPPISWPDVYAGFAARFDRKLGGRGAAPKFPMPCEWQFLLRYGVYAKNEECLRQVRLTLDKMAAGGIYDQLGGGFARYSTDEEWKAPHFEKMLYDNAQLIELYAEASVALKEPFYREVALDIVRFLERELAAPGGGYCSALDADSEGEEGLYYVWTRAELEPILGERFAWFADFYGVDGEGLWEHGRNILLRRYSFEELGAKQGWTPEETKANWGSAQQDLMAVREKRIRPMLDDKVLTSWNGLLLKGFSVAYRCTGETSLRDKAEVLAEFLLRKSLRPDGGLWHRGVAEKVEDTRLVSGAEPFAIEGFLEDYAFLAEGLVELYQCTFEERYLSAARALTEYALTHFHDEVSPLLFFTADNAPSLLVRKKETMDNVIPSSNSALARVLLQLGEYYAEPRYRERAEAMASAVRGDFPVYASAYAYWAQTLYLESIPTATLAIVGPDAAAFKQAATGIFAPHLLLAVCDEPSQLPLLRDKFKPGVTLGFRCQHGTCGLPTEDWRSLQASEAPAV